MTSDWEALLEGAWEALGRGDLAGVRKRARRAAELDPKAAEPEILLAQCAADEGKLPDALAHATRALALAEEEEELLAAVTLKADVEVAMGKDEAARKTMAELPPASVVPENLDLALHAADVFMDLGEPAQARSRYQSVLDRAADDVDAWYGLGLAAEALEDEDGKRTAWVRALALDAADVNDDDDLMTEAEFAAVAEAALAELPPRARELLRNVPIVIAELPSKDDVATGLDPRLLGLFAGTPHTEAGALGGTPQVTQIILFRRNLDRAAADEDELRDEIRTTLLHETGHFFGMDEDDLAAVGLD